MTEQHGPPLDLRALRSFVVVLDEGSITRAAARLHVAQQSLSQQMRVLEARFGAALLDRSSRGVTPTPAGTVLHGEALALLAAADRVAATVRRSVLEQNLHLRVGFLSSLANEVMPPVVSAFAVSHPLVQLHAADLPVADLVAGVRDGTLDAAITRPPLIDDLASDALGSEGVVIALPTDHPLAQRRRLRMSELADEPWVQTARSSWPPWHRAHDADFAAAGFRPRVVQHSTTPQGLLALVAAGVGITRLASSARSLRRGGVRFVALDGQRAPIVLLTRHDATHPALPEFRAATLAALSEHLAGYQPPD